MAVAAALALQLAAAACVAVAFFTIDDVTVEGAYFDRATGDDAVTVAMSTDVRAWLVAAGVLTLLAAGMWLLALHARPPRRRLQRRT